MTSEILLKVIKAETKETKAGNPYLIVSGYQKTGEVIDGIELIEKVQLSMFQDHAERNRSLRTGDFLKVRIRVKEYSVENTELMEVDCFGESGE